MSARHEADLVVCGRMAGSAVGMLCDRCEGRCVSCDSHVHQKNEAKICDECAFNNAQRQKCIQCCRSLGATGVAGANAYPAYYCIQCVTLEKDRDGCPRILNVGSTRLDAIYSRRSGQ